MEAIKPLPNAAAPATGRKTLVVFFRNGVLISGRCGRWQISWPLFRLIAAAAPGLTRDQLGAWLWWLRVETTPLRDYAMLHGVN